MPGTRYTIMPVPIVEAHTEYLDAGPIRFGIEYRVLNDEILTAAYQDDPESLATLAQTRPPVLPEDRGVSIHVLGAQDGLEYLRFDCFQEEPHYHYLNHMEHSQDRVDQDPIADGDMLDWSLERIRTRLPQMLAHARGEHLLQGLDPQRLEEALVRVRAAAERAAHAGAPAPVAPI